MCQLFESGDSTLMSPYGIAGRMLADQYSFVTAAEALNTAWCQYSNFDTTKLFHQTADGDSCKLVAAQQSDGSMKFSKYNGTDTSIKGVVSTGYIKLPLPHKSLEVNMFGSWIIKGDRFNVGIAFGLFGSTSIFTKCAINFDAYAKKAALIYSTAGNYSNGAAPLTDWVRNIGSMSDYTVNQSSVIGTFDPNEVNTITIQATLSRDGDVTGIRWGVVINGNLVYFDNTVKKTSYCDVTGIHPFLALNTAATDTECYLYGMRLAPGS